MILPFTSIKCRRTWYISLQFQHPILSNQNKTLNKALNVLLRNEIIYLVAIFPIHFEVNEHYDDNIHYKSIDEQQQPHTKKEITTRNAFNFNQHLFGAI